MEYAFECGSSWSVGRGGPMGSYTFDSQCQSAKGTKSSLSLSSFETIASSGPCEKAPPPAIDVCVANGELRIYNLCQASAKIDKSGSFTNATCDLRTDLEMGKWATTILTFSGVATNTGITMTISDEEKFYDANGATLFACANQFKAMYSSSSGLGLAASRQ